ncbi:MAG: hypothetical protein WCA11_07605 [Terracidiphilus sp.]
MRAWSRPVETPFSRLFKPALFVAIAAFIALAVCTPAQEPLAMLKVSRTVPTVIREIDDPHTGMRWVLLRNPVHPAGPAHVALVDNGKNEIQIGGARSPDVQRVPASEAPRPLIVHRGDRLIVEENTATIEARLEAIAMGAAARGGEIQARLKIGGKLVKVVALGAGRAALAPVIEVWP